MQKLEQRVVDMLKLIEDIGRENETLRTDQSLLRQEFKALQEKK